MGVPWRGRALGTACPEDFMLLWSIALFAVLSVTTSLLISEVCEPSEGFRPLTGQCPWRYSHSD